MFLRKISIFTILLVLLTFNLFAQSKPIQFQLEKLSGTIGTWNGTLTYLDYTTGKPYSMPANIKISYSAGKLGYISSFEYPDEPKANAIDTTYLKNKGTYFGDEKVVSFVFKQNGDFTLITEIEGVDGNDKKKAILRHSYLLIGNAYSISKEVKFKGATNWIKRNEYKFTKEKKVTVIEKSLFDKIALLDSLMFATYNNQNIAEMKSYFTNDLEWYQDNGGLLNFETVFKNFQSIFDNKNKLSRALVTGSLEVIPIKGYGAIEIGKHQFKHMENGKLEIGTFRFLMIWKNDNETWKISRVVSFDH